MEAGKGSWNESLCGCFGDLGICCMTFWCPCIQVGRNVEVLTEGFTGFYTGCCIFLCLDVAAGFGCLYSCTFRKRLRLKYGLPESPCPDICVHCCCLVCAICQEARELKSRGYDPAKGWEVYAKAPPPTQIMA